MNSVSISNRENEEGLVGDNSVNNLGGSVLCCDLTNDSYVRQGNSRFWNEVDGNITIKVWKSIKQLGIEGEEDDKFFEGIIRGLEKRERRNVSAVVEIHSRSL